MSLEPIKSLNSLAKKRETIGIGILIAVIFIIFLIIYFVKSDAAVPSVSKTTQTHFTNPVAHSSNDLWREQQETSVANANKRAEGLMQKVDELEQSQAQQMQLIQEQDAAIKAMQEKSQSNPAATTLNNTSNDYPGEGATGVGNNGVNSGATERQIAITRFPLTPKKPANSVYTSKNYVPAGSFVRAVMLSGLDAPTGVNNQAEPVPVLLRLTSWGNLPNNATSHIKSCFMTAAGIGDISSERAYIRTEQMSCTLTNGHIIDLPVEATVVGPDGKDGVRGPVVWREGAMIQRAAAAGLLSGFSNALAQTYTVQSLTPFGATSVVNNKQTMEYGLANGAANGMNELADYFIKRAEEYQPVVEVSGGTSVDVMVLQGFYLPTSQGKNLRLASNNGDMSLFGGP